MTPRSRRLFVPFLAAAGALGTIWLAASAIAVPPVTQDQFTLTRGMPEIRGRLSETRERTNRDTGSILIHQRYQDEGRDIVTLTHATKAYCGVVGAFPRDEALFIVAIRHIPRNPASFLAATAHDRFDEVYVRDLEGRIRLYRDLPNAAMAELSQHFEPYCTQL